MKGLGWRWKIRLRLIILVLLVWSGMFLSFISRGDFYAQKEQKRFIRQIESAYLTAGEDNLKEFSRKYFQTHPELIYLSVWNRNSEQVFKGARDFCYPENQIKGWLKWNCQKLGNAYGVEVKVITPQGRRTILALYHPRFFVLSPALKYWIFFLVVLAGGIGLALIFAQRIVGPVKKLVPLAKSVEPRLLSNLEERDELGFLKSALEIIRKEKVKKDEYIVRLQKAFRNWRRVQSRKYKQKIAYLERTLNLYQAQLSDLVERLKSPARHIAQMSRLLYLQASEQLPVEMEGRFLILMREAEKCRDILLETEKALEQKKEPPEEMELVNLSELLFDLGPELDSLLKHYQAEIRTKSPLPTIYCHPARLRSLFQGIIEELLAHSPCPENPVIEVGYNNLEERLLFYFSLRGEVEKSSEEAESEAEPEASRGSQPSLVLNAIVESYGGELWRGKNEEGNAIVFFTLSKDFLRPTSREREAA